MGSLTVSLRINYMKRLTALPVPGEKKISLKCTRCYTPSTHIIPSNHDFADSSWGQESHADLGEKKTSRKGTIEIFQIIL